MSMEKQTWSLILPCLPHCGFPPVVTSILLEHVGIGGLSSNPMCTHLCLLETVTGTHRRWYSRVSTQRTAVPVPVGARRVQGIRSEVLRGLPLHPVM